MKELDRVILASQSKARRRLLRRLGLKFHCRPAHIDEEAPQALISDPRRLVCYLARAKAQAVFQQLQSHDSRTRLIVIGSDQLVVLHDPRHRGPVIFGKPHRFSWACEQLRRCSGRQVSILTAVHVETEGFRKSWVHQTRMTFRKLTTSEIRAYVALDQPLDCAGSFMFERNGIRLFDSIRTDDPTAIEGLPLLSLQRVLRSL